MGLRAPIGVSDFRKLREIGATYVDKTRFLVDVLTTPTEVLLVPRPRRFGKTLNLSTLRYFVERGDDDRAPLFEGLDVERSDAARAHAGRYPVVFLTFKDVKARRFEDCVDALRTVLAVEFERHRDVLRGARLTARQQRVVDDIGTAGTVALWNAVRELSAMLAQATGERAVILVDEYDTPIHAAYLNGYYEDAIELFRNLLSGAFKDNEHLAKGVLTGILRVARESIFSGLNNLGIYSTSRPELATAFGFTEPEVTALADLAGARDHLDELRRWYDGYRFGDEVIFNPWSVLNFLDSRDRVPRNYWTSTSADDLLRTLLTRSSLAESGDLETLLRGGSVERAVDENIVLRDLDAHAGAVWSFLLFSGYLTRTPDATGLRIPNREVEETYRDVFVRWLESGVGGPARLRAMLDALLAGDAARIEPLLGDLVRDTLSYHDVGGRTPERVYHAFVAGLLVHLEPEYEVRSNRESGHGRVDLMIVPRSSARPGVVLELKTLGPGETIDAALRAAGAQLRDRDYAAELRARGAAPIHELAAVFDGKHVHVRPLPGST